MRIFRRKKYAWVDLMERMIAQPELYDREYREIEKRYPELGHKLHNLRFMLDFIYIRRAYFEDIIDKINFQALQYSLHNYNIKTERSNKDDFFDSLITAMNMLGEELNYSTITRQYLNDVFNAIPDLIFVLDNHGIIQSYNHSVNQELLFSEEELKHKSICEIIQEPETFFDLTDFEKYQRILHLKTKDNRLIPVSIKTNKFIRGNQDEAGWILMFSNVSSLIKYKVDLEQALNKAQENERLKSVFLANISHEIRTPMNSIVGFSEILLNNKVEDEQKTNFLTFIHSNANRLLSLLNDLIRVSQIEAGVIKANFESVDLKALVLEIVTAFRYEAELKKLSLSLNFKLEDNNLIVLTDKTKLESILSNLIKNAIKFTEKGGIEVTCSETDKMIEFSVKDTGIGIPDERKEYIFDRFIQADIDDKRALQGSGLGLTIAKSYTELLGGKIFFVSEEGNGTVFYVHLPKMGAVKPEETSVIIAEINKNIKKLKTEIVEDDLSSQALLKYILQEYSEQLIYASNGEEAVEMCKKYPDLDLIMMDIKMPVMDGLTATKEIRTFNKNVVVIAQTAFAMKGDEEKALNAGCNDFLTKPILKETLVGILKKWFNKDYFSD